MVDQVITLWYLLYGFMVRLFSVDDMCIVRKDFNLNQVNVSVMSKFARNLGESQDAWEIFKKCKS